MAALGLDSFFNAFQTKIEEPVRLHLKNVYACLALSTLVAAAGTVFEVYTRGFLGFLSIIGAIGFSLAVNWSVDNGKNRQTRLFYLLGLSFCIGSSLGPLIDRVILIDPALIVTAFLSTCFVFISFSISAMLAKRGSWLFLSGTITSILLCLLFFSFVSIFYSSKMFFQIHLYLGLVLMCMFVLYDTQMIMEKRRLGDKDFIRHSVDLFLDFVGIFKRLLILLAQKEENDRRKNSRK